MPFRQATYCDDAGELGRLVRGIRRSGARAAAASSPTSEPSTGTSRPASTAFGDLVEVVLRRAPTPPPGARRDLLPQDRAVELLELRARLEPELVDERAARVLVRVERLRLPPRAVERQHQLSPRSRSRSGMLRDERFELAARARPCRPSASSASIQLLDRREPELLEPARPPSRERLEARTRRAARRARARARSRSSSARRSAAASPSLLARRRNSKRGGRSSRGSTRGRSPARPSDERVGARAPFAAPRSSSGARSSAVRGGVSPQSASISESVETTRPALQEQEREHRPLLLAAECNRHRRRVRPRAGRDTRKRGMCVL